MNIGRVGTRPSGNKARQGGSRSWHPPSQGVPKVGDGGLGAVPVPILLSHCRVLTAGSSGYHPTPPQHDNPVPASSHPLDPLSILMSHHPKAQGEVAQECPNAGTRELLAKKGNCVKWSLLAAGWPAGDNPGWRRPGGKGQPGGSWAVWGPPGVVGASQTPRGSLRPLKHLWVQTGRLQLLPKQQVRPVREEESLPW